MDRDQPTSPGTAAFAVTGALLAGAGAIALSAMLSANLWRLALAVALTAAGWAIHRRGRDPEHPVARALGGWTLRGIGGGLAVLGAHLTGLVVLAVAAGGGLFDEAGETAGGMAVVLVVYGLPALALVLLAAGGGRAWSAGAGAVGVVLVVLVLVTANASAAVVAVTMLVVAVALTVVVVRAPADSAWGDAASAAGGLAAGYAFGVGSSPFGTVGAGQTGARVAGPDGTLVGAAGGAVLALALVVAAVLVLVAVLRRDPAGGVLAGAVFATVPFFVGPGDMSEVARWVEAAVAAVVVVIALVAARRPAVRAGFARVIATARSGGAEAAAACGAAIAVALVVFVVQALPLFPVELWVQGLIGLALLLVAGLLAYALPGTAGASAAVAVLVGLQLFPLWPRLLLAVGDGARVPAGVLAFVTAVAVSWLFVARHGRVAVWAGSAYLLAGAGAALVGALAAGAGVDPSDGGAVVAVTALVAPLAVLGVAAVVAVRSDRFAAHGQAVGAVVLAAAGFLPLTVLAREFARADLAVVNGLRALTPTDLGLSRAVREVTGPVLVALVVMVVLALVLAASTTRRPSAALAGGAVLVLLGGAQLMVLAALDEHEEWVPWTFGALGLAMGVLAAVTAVTAGRSAPPPVAGR